MELASQEILFQVRAQCPGVTGCNARGCSWCTQNRNGVNCQGCCCNGDGSCFPATSKVDLENGKSVAMSELQIGDKVQTGINTPLLCLVVHYPCLSCFPFFTSGIS